MKQKSLLIITTFIEGIAVMMVEIAGARMIAPVFGTSLHTWSLVLGITLLGLAAGYFTGGYLAKSEFKKIDLQQILLVLGVFLLILPVLADFILSKAINFSFYSGLIFSLLILILPPLWLLGTISPVLVHKMDKYINITGLSSGRIFAISTVGGILGALGFGLYLLPSIGITISLVGAGTIILILAVLNGLFKVKHISFILIAYFGLVAFNYNNTSKYNDSKIIYNSDGILGQVKVIQATMYKGQQPIKLRMQMINNTLQAMIDINNPTEPYMHYQSLLIPVIEKNLQEGNVLMLGLGGGLIFNAFAENKNLKFDAVELDEHIVESAQKLFLNPKQDRLKIHIADARHFIEASNKKYEMIIIDTFAGESVPGHIITKESLEKMKKMLSKDGSIIINFHGYWQGEKGLGARSVIKTIKEVNFNTKILATNSENGIKRGLLFIASANDKMTVNINDINISNESKELSAHEINYSEADLKNAEILTDDKQQLDHMLNEVCLEWRRYCINTYVKHFEKENQPLFW